MRRRWLAVLGGGTAFTPTSLSNLYLWLDGAYGLYPTSNFSGLPCTEGQSIGSWKDMRNNGTGVIQTTAANQPVFTFNSVGDGYPGMVDDGTNFLGIAQTLFDKMTVFIAFENRTGINGTLFGTASGGASPVQRNTEAYWRLASPYPGGTYSGATTLNASKIFTATYDFTGGTSIMRLDGVQRLTYTGSLGTKPTAFIGIGIGGGEALSGNILQVIIYDRILSTEEMARIESWLLARCFWTISPILLEDSSGSWTFEDGSVISYPN